ncbi:cysteine--1-D-myo-inosityl 2-amino-2-deoxy-alpha-D-glucopyranoside ligase [Nesterenkonia halobia]|uniref:L-cysteine:1D-myo-inositol 2-amino-2-deoxy-alpha-D-glucopyranoside ligase n=1 Tax=Nesterenkonia halobia TaxID=37922 RepID=A0ABP6RFJ4_9MICC
MESWTSPTVPSIPALPPTLRLHDTATGRLADVEPRDGVGSLYVCGITPYDATHLGHANTYVNFDLLVRYWRACGLEVQYVQNVTDVDDPLFERAAATGIDWRELGEEQTELFRRDMAALGVIAPDVFRGAAESVPEVVADVERLVEAGIGYRVPVPESERVDAADGDDVYFDIAAAESATDWRLGSIGAYDRAAMEELFPERGGDPQRAGKRDALDPLLWSARRAGEPWWEGGALGPGRPGWHIECSVISRRHLPAPFAVQGGGSDLRFPHHEFSAAHATAADGVPLAETYVHTGMVGLRGEKMSKSQGNLVLVSALRADGVDPQAVRVLLLSHHHRSDWSFTDEELAASGERLQRWKEALARAPQSARGGDADQEPEDLQHALHSTLSQDLNAPAALEQLDRWAAGQLAAGTDAARAADVVQALLGIDLRA